MLAHESDTKPEAMKSTAPITAAAKPLPAGMIRPEIDFLADSDADGETKVG